ncbi:MAG TPA: IS21-like element helper ATPase IstB [Steroidobacteraceae bacterium]|nr:IS21-like element helper ATPase IstB [Steroidobacteraceae bacterium]
MSRVATKELLGEQLRSLKIPGAARSVESLARQAREEKWSYEEFLSEVLAAEQASRHESAVRQRISEARFPEVKTLDTFDFGAASGPSAPQIAELCGGSFIDRAENIIFAGPIGTGKTHLSIAIGVEAARKRRRVLFLRAADLVRFLVEARDARELSRLQRKLHSIELLICDEFGFVPFDRVGGELLFNIIAERYERRSVILTTNLSFGEWPKVLGGDEKLATALLDRLAHHAVVITTKGKSYRMRKRLDGDAPSPPPTELTPKTPRVK